MHKLNLHCNYKYMMQFEENWAQHKLLCNTFIMKHLQGPTDDRYSLLHSENESFPNFSGSMCWNILECKILQETETSPIYWTFLLHFVLLPVLIKPLIACVVY